MKNQHLQIAQILISAYPAGACSQGYGRDIALQLPRVISDFRYKPTWQLESYKPLKENLISVDCIHPHTRQAADYKLSAQGFEKLRKHYSLTTTGTPAPQPKQYHEIMLEEMDKQVKVWSERLQRWTWETPKREQLSF